MKIVVLCGSSRHVDIIAVCAWLIERDEGAITMGIHLLPRWYSDDLPEHHAAEHEGVSAAMDELHLRKIDMADEIFVVNHGHYIGDSTGAEVEYARARGKRIRWFTSDPIGRDVEQRILQAQGRETLVRATRRADTLELQTIGDRHRVEIYFGMAQDAQRFVDAVELQLGVVEEVK